MGEISRSQVTSEPGLGRGLYLLAHSETPETREFSGRWGQRHDECSLKPHRRRRYLFSLTPPISHPHTNMNSATPSPEAEPSITRYIIGFLLIGLAWGFTTPFIRAAARTHKPPSHP